MSFDLNSAQGFASLTLSSASGVLNQLAGLNNGTWDIQESAYGHEKPYVKFHIFKTASSDPDAGILSKIKEQAFPTQNDYEGAVPQVQDQISRRVVQFEYPYVNGQTTDDLGGGGQTYDFDIILFGQAYYKAYLRLLEEFNKTAPGTLVHPVYGPIRAKFKQAVITHNSEKRQAITLRATFVSHDFDVQFRAAKDTTKSALATAVGFIGSIDNILTKIQSNIATFGILKSTALELVKAYKSFFNSTLVALNTTFNNGSSSDIPGLLPNNTAQGTSFPTVASPNDPFANVTVSTIQAQQSPALASLQAIDRVKALRALLTELIISLEIAAIGGVKGSGALEFYDDILTLKQSGVAIQKVLEIGLQSSNSTVKNYSVPRLMSIREVCFLNGLSVDRSFELEQLNPDLLSVNFIERGVSVKVPTS